MDKGEKANDDSGEEKVLEQTEEEGSPTEEDNQKSEDKPNEKEKPSFFKEKFWFALAIFFFVIASCIAYELIWEGLTPHDEPRILHGGNTSISLTSDMLGFGEVNSTFETCAYIYTSCKPEKDVFVVDSNMICTTTLINSNNPKCNSFLNSSYVLVERLLICYTPFEINDSKSCRLYLLDPPINGYGQYNYSLMLSHEGSVYIRFESIYQPIERGYNQHLYDRSFKMENLRDTILLVKSHSEVESKKMTRTTSFVLALFALFGIFPAVYYLRRLWRDENGERKK